MNIKDVLGTKVLDKQAYEVGTISDFVFDPKSGNIGKAIVSLKKGVFSKEELEINFSDIETIGAYVLLGKELPKEEAQEVEVETNDDEE